MCGLSSDHDHYPYMHLVSVLFKSSSIYSLTLHPIHFFNVFYLFISFFLDSMLNGGELYALPMCSLGTRLKPRRAW